MEKIKIKPSLKIEKFFIIIGLIFLLTIILFPFGFIILLFSIVSLFGKKYSNYEINEQQINIKYEFISKINRVYRIDQITSLVLKQSFFEKKFNLGTISFGLFGKSSDLVKNGTQNNSVDNYYQSLLSIDNYKNIFRDLNELLSMPVSKILYIDKPSLKPIKFLISLLFILFISLIFGYFMINISSITSNLILPIIILFIILFISYFQYLKIRTVSYSITEKYVKFEYNYIFGSRLEIIPLNKITNIEVNKNILSYFLFKIGLVKIYTGGSYDPVFSSLVNFEKFKNILIKENKISRNNLNENILNKLDSINSNNNIEDKNVNILKNNNLLYKTKPGLGFILTKFNIFFSILVLFSLLINLLLFIIIFFIYIIYILIKFIILNNTKYLFYEDKVVIITGIMNINRKEIYFNQIKYIILNRNFLFGKFLKQGDIYLLTPGSAQIDGRIYSIKNYNNIYNEFKEVILE